MRMRIKFGELFKNEVIEMEDKVLIYSYYKNT